MAEKSNPKSRQGLTEKEAMSKLASEGYNELPSAHPKSVLNIVFDVAKEPMFILLVACGTLYMLLGDIGEGLMLLASVIIIIIITFYQEKKTERALESLRELSSPRALVVRDGIEKRIAGKEIVTDDIILLREGDRVAADAFVLDELNLKVDESLLTGESASVLKNKWNEIDTFGKPTSENSAFVYSGTLVVQGNGVAKVAATGINSELGKIGISLNKVQEEPTLLQKETGRIIKTFSFIGFGVCIILIIVYGLMKNDWLHGILTGLSLAMALLPEEFAVVLTIFMAMGAWRISQKNVLTRKASSIETLGSVTVLCTDKTGTLTENRMSVRKLLTNKKITEIRSDLNSTLDEDYHPLIEYGMLASQPVPFDPMEKALVKIGNHKLDSGHSHKDWVFIKEYPLSPKLLAMSRVYRHPNNAEYVIAAKGSPEAIVDLCHLEKEIWKETEQAIENFASEGLRVLGVAKARMKSEEFPEDQHDFNFEFMGLVGFEDPLRAEVPENLRTCYEAGIRVVMITGDYPVTAQHLARKMG
ncbi:MAG TPA: HAD-IC family P-type ATPase, partial [Bacteroidia bacterium]